MIETNRRPWEASNYPNEQISDDDLAMMEKKWDKRYPPISDEEQASREEWWLKNHTNDGEPLRFRFVNGKKEAVYID